MWWSGAHIGCDLDQERWNFDTVQAENSSLSSKSMYYASSWNIWNIQEPKHFYVMARDHGMRTSWIFSAASYKDQSFSCFSMVRSMSGNVVSHKALGFTSVSVVLHTHRVHYIASVKHTHMCTGAKLVVLQQYCSVPMSVRLWDVEALLMLKLTCCGVQIHAPSTGTSHEVSFRPFMPSCRISDAVCLYFLFPFSLLSLSVSLWPIFYFLPPSFFISFPSLLLLLLALSGTLGVNQKYVHTYG